MITVLITTFNRLSFLRRAIDSVRRQENVEFEILVIDDCSSDGTVDYLKSQSDIRFISKDSNRGLVHSRNLGVQEAVGTYIAFLDDDDYWIDEFKLRRQYDEILSDEKVIVCSSVMTASGVLTPTLPLDWRKRIIYRNGFIHTSSVLLNVDAIREFGGFDVNLKRGIDSDLYRTLILKHDYRVNLIEDPLVWYETESHGRITKRKNRKERAIQMLYLFSKYFYIFKRAPYHFMLRQYVTFRDILR